MDREFSETLDLFVQSAPPSQVEGFLQPLKEWFSISQIVPFLTGDPASSRSKWTGRLHQGLGGILQEIGYKYLPNVA